MDEELTGRFQAALRGASIGDVQLAMLRHHAAYGSSSTTDLAVAAGYDSYTTANGIYGKLGNALYDEVNDLAEPRADGRKPGITALATTTDAADRTGPYFEWTVRPELVEAAAREGLLERAAIGVGHRPTDDGLRSALMAGDVPVWITGFWGFTPDTWGGVTFSKEGRARNLAGVIAERGTGHGFVVIYGTQSPQVDERERRRVLGVYAVAPVVRPIEDLADAEALRAARAKSDNPEDKWPFALKAVRAWRLASEKPTIQDFAPDSYDVRAAQSISTMAKEITAAERDGLFDHEWREVPVYGGEPIATPSEADGFEPVPSGPFRREGYEVAADDGRKHVYLLAWRGDASALLGAPLRPGSVVVKAGASRSPEERLAGLRSAFPCPGHIGWTLERSSQAEGLGPFAAEEARALEVALQRALEARGRGLGGEFFLVQTGDLAEAWAAALSHRADAGLRAAS